MIEKDLSGKGDNRTSQFSDHDDIVRETEPLMPDPDYEQQQQQQYYDYNQYGDYQGTQGRPIYSQ